MEMSEDGTAVVDDEAYFGSFGQRIRDIAVNPYTGAFYLAFNGTSYPGSPPNIIKEFSTSDPASVPSPVVEPVLIRPIPARGQVDISVTDGALGGPLVVRDLAGRIVHEGQVETLRFQMDIEGWAPGRYTVWTATGASPMMVH